jgi:hypothetical protein
MQYKLILIIFFLFDKISFAEQNNTLNNIPETNTLNYALTQGQLKGLLRYSGQYRDSHLQILQDNSSTKNTANKKKQQYSAIGGYLGYETAPLFNISLGATLYTSQPIGNNPDNRKGLGGLYEENGKQESYTVLGETFIKYQYDDHLLKAGRQEIPNYRFVSLSNVRMTPITHEGIIYENTHWNHLQINFAYMTKMKERNADKFIDMATGARLKEFSNGRQIVRGNYDPSEYNGSGYNGSKKEMNIVGLTYNTDTVSIESWNYYIHDFINTFYLYSQYNLPSKNNNIALSLSTQYTNQADVGNHIAGNIDTWFYGLKFQAIMDKTTVFISYNEVDYNENSYDGGSIFVRWGSPQMFNSFQVQDSELAGTQSIGAGIQYQFSQNSMIPGVIMRLRYANYDMPNSLYKTDSRQDRSETTVDFNYAFGKKYNIRKSSLDNLSIQFRVSYNNYETHYDFTTYKQIHGYNTDHVTDDFIDIRLYFDYKF